MPQYLLFQLHLTEAQNFEVAAVPSSPLADAMFAARMGRVDGALAMDLYRPVARLEASDLEDLFTRTNSIDAPWYEAPEIDLLVTGGAPSTSVGDIAIETETGQGHFCADFGWKPLAASECETLMRNVGDATSAPDESPEGP